MIAFSQQFFQIKRSSATGKKQVPVAGNEKQAYTTDNENRGSAAGNAKQASTHENDDKKTG